MTHPSVTFDETRKCFVGDVCPLHPELNGQRMPASGECTGCATPAAFMEQWQRQRKETGDRKHMAGRERAAAKLSGDKTYRGKLCERHRDLVGKRYTASGNCTGCMAEYLQKRRAKRLADSTVFYAGKLCEHHPELKGKRYISNNQCEACAKAAVKASQAKAKARKLKAEIDAAVDRQRSS